MLAPGQVNSEQRVLLVPSIADHRYGGYSPPHEAAAINLMSDHINMFSLGIPSELKEKKIVSFFLIVEVSLFYFIPTSM